jgi:hypothetical protein
MTFQRRTNGGNTMNLRPSTYLVSIGMLAATLAILPAASADTTYACALDPAPPCVRVIHGDTTGDGDCDAANGAGSRSHSVDAWTGANPAGNQSVTAQNRCGDYGQLMVRATYILPQGRFYYWDEVGWYQFSSGCYAWAYGAGRGNPAAFYQDLAPVVCQAGAPPMLP